MEKVSVHLHYDSSREELLEKSTMLVHTIYTGLLGREPNKEDAPRFEQRINPDDNSLNDIYFDNKKVGSLATNFIPNGPKGISLDYTPID
jgi:hypothetical protein